jgi:hypothetical protein
MKKFICTTAVGGLVLVTSNLFAQKDEVVLECSADLSFPGTAPNMLTVRITRTSQGTLQSQVNGKVSNKNFNPIESRIRENFDFNVDPSVPDARNINAGELSLAHLQSIRDLINIPFDLKDVRRTVIYDLQGTTDKYGGTVLIEAYGVDGRLLGRVLRSAMASRCS